MAEIDWNRYEHFSSDEFDHPDKMDPNFLRKLDIARELAGRPFILTSDLRPDERSAHSSGTAVDIRASSGAERWAIVMAALRAGFTRIGIYDRHLHLDDDPEKPSNVLWPGISQ